MFAHHASEGAWKMYPHIEPIDRALVDVHMGKCPRLIIEMPPGHGKSELVSRYFPPWHLGLKPEEMVMLLSYESKFAAEWGGKGRTIVEDHGASAYGIQIKQDSKAASHWDIKGHDGGMRTSGVRGPITGRHPNIIIIDDPIKNEKEAMSRTHRNGLWGWFTGTVYDRLEPGGSIIMIMPRWHQDDLIGRLRKEDGDDWRIITLPAIAEKDDSLGRKEGEALCPDRYPIKELQKIKRFIGSHWFSAKFQQRPRNPDGELWKLEDLSNTYDFNHDQSIISIGDEGNIRKARVADLIRFMTVDPAIKTTEASDYTAIGVWGLSRHTGNLFLMDVEHDRIKPSKLIPKIKELMKKWDVGEVNVESVAFQYAIIEQALEDGLPFRECPVDTDKYSRAAAAQPIFEGGKVWLPRGVSWRGEFEEELLDFPKGEHDDYVDIVSMAAKQVRTYAIGGQMDPTGSGEKEEGGEFSSEFDTRDGYSSDFK